MARRGDHHVGLREMDDTDICPECSELYEFCQCEQDEEDEEEI